MNNNNKKCPYCGKEIRINALKCRHCNKWLVDKPDYIKANENTRKFDNCIKCHKSILDPSKHCPNCGYVNYSKSKLPYYMPIGCILLFLIVISTIIIIAITTNPDRLNIDKTSYLKPNLKESNILETREIRLKHNSTFNKTISTNKYDEEYPAYKTIKGIESYLNLNNDNVMHLVKEENIKTYGTNEHKEALKILNNLLDNKLRINFSSYSQDNPIYNFNNHVGRLFTSGIMNYGSDLSGEINGIQYPNTDKVKAYFTIDGQSPPLGDISVIVLAKKGNSYILLEASTGMSTNNADMTFRPLFQKCYDLYGYTDQARQCYVKLLAEDQEAQKILKEKTKKLIKEFEIE